MITNVLFTLFWCWFGWNINFFAALLWTDMVHPNYKWRVPKFYFHPAVSVFFAIWIFVS